ncbi:PBECR2 nuclease fold domain-containing protein [Campylobacter showae]|uniref:PBECR2 nuclease fold domain-containing protein n=1 Tax=Campylobacter showae TaxID=204 RepID=UPI000F081666|nr:PBECR2 nuclease fold domain-containing protein [Campylobacter showae]
MSLSLIRQADYKPTKDKLIRLKQSLDDGIFASTGKSGMELERLKNSLYDADVKYSQMKRIEDDSLYEGIQKGTTKELTQAKLDKKFRNTNDKLNEYLSGLDAPSRERLEIEAIKNTLERNIKETMGGKRVVDYSGMLKTLKDNPNYKSEAAKKAIEITEKMNKIHGLDHTLADAFKAPKDPKLQQGLSHNVAVRYLTMAANRAVQNTVKFLPFLQMGKTAASRHAIYNAVMSSSSVQELGEKLSKAAMNKDIPISEKIDIIEMAKAQFKFSNELDKAKADGIVKETAEQGSKIEQAEAKQEAVKGEGWTMRDGGDAKQYAEHKFEVEKWINDLSGVLSDEWIANLKSLALKHPEMFRSEADVFRVIKEIKDNPTHFFKNNRDDAALIAKELKDEKAGNIVIKKDDGRIVHVNKTRKSDIARLQRNNEKALEGTPTPSILDAEINPAQTRRFAATPNDEIISQKGNLVNEKEANELKSLSKEYDVEQFLKDREGILAKDARHGKTRFSESRIEDNGGVGGWEYKRTPAGYDKNYKADFLITKADVAKIRGGKIDEQTLGKLKQDLESSEYLGYEYKKTHKNNGADEYADEEFFKGAPVESKGGHSAAAAIEEQRFAGTGRDKTTIMYVNPHVGAGLAGGTLNAKDENGNFDAEKFAKGFIYGLFGSKVTAATLKKTNPKLYDQIVNIGKDKAGKEKISSFVNKLKQDELGKLLQKTITNKDLSTKTKVEIIEAAKKRFAKESPKSLNGQSEAQMSESALKAKENNLKIDDVSNDAKEKWIKTFGLKSIDDDFIPNLKPEVKKAIKDKEIRLTKGSLLKIVARGREKYIPLIKQSLEDTDMVLKDEGTFLFVKEMDDKSLVFTSVGRNFDTHITIISNAPKKINNIKNKLMNKAEVVYRSSKLRTTPL